jgi:hypothetical protein
MMPDPSVSLFFGREVTDFVSSPVSRRKPRANKSMMARVKFCDQATKTGQSAVEARGRQPLSACFFTISTGA